jgi:glycosyltransferase involved in cell wall biosynthesis
LPKRTTSRSPRVIYWNNIPAPYMVERFNALADRGRVDLEVWFSERTVPDRSWRIDEGQWRFRHRYLPRIALGGRGVALATSLLRRPKPDLLILQYGALEYILGWTIAVLRGWRTAFWVEVTFDSSVRRRIHREWLKRQMFSRVDGIMTAGADGMAFARRYSAAKDRIHLVRHVVDAEFYSVKAMDSRRDRDDLRKRLGVEGTLFLYVGRLWEPKGIFELIEAYGRVRAAGVSASLVIVGDGRDESRLRSEIERRGLDRVIFAGFIQRDDLPPWYAAADVLVFPTRADTYGMVVDEAMAAGVPVISTTTAGEIRTRVIEGKTGWLVPAQDPDALAKAMASAAEDPTATRRLGTVALKLMEGQGPSRWAEEFEEATLQILASARPRLLGTSHESA